VTENKSLFKFYRAKSQVALATPELIRGFDSGLMEQLTVPAMYLSFLRIYVT